jgi:hypothetical protein
VYGFDGGKLVKGRKRQTIVDSLGLLLKVVVSEGNAPVRVLAAYALMELLEHRFSNRRTKEKSAQSEVNNEEENRVNADQTMLIAISKP